MAPKPPAFGAPRRSRGAPLSTWGPRHGPHTPNVRCAPAEPGRSSVYMGAPTWPPYPQRSERRGGAGAPLFLHGGPDMGPIPPTFGAPRRSRGAPLSPHTPRRPRRSSKSRADDEAGVAAPEVGGHRGGR